MLAAVSEPDWQLALAVESHSAPKLRPADPPLHLETWMFSIQPEAEIFLEATGSFARSRFHRLHGRSAKPRFARLRLCFRGSTESIHKSQRRAPAR